MPTADVSLRRELVYKLITSGALKDRRWIDAFATVPRHTFVPDFWHNTPRGLERITVDGTGSRSVWLDIIYRDIPLITQLDQHGVATCSSSQPTMMAHMLEALRVASGHTVLEVGTGTGYNTALLAHRLGPGRVVTVEYDPTLGTSARARLSAASYQAHCVLGDGADGHPDRAPYDRIIATYGLRRIPTAWIRQSRPGTIIVANIGYGLIALTVNTTLTAATGRFLPTAAGFMWSRTDPAVPAVDRVLRITRRTGATRPPVDTTHFDDERFIAWLRLFAPHLTHTILTVPGRPDEHLFASDNDNWMRATIDNVISAGNTYDTVTRAHQAWTDAGMPDRSQLGLTVTIDGEHHLWVDDEQTGRWCLTDPSA